MLLIVGTVRMPPEELNDARMAMQEMIEARLEEDGCQAYSYSEDVMEPGLIHVTEVKRSTHILKPTIWPNGARIGIASVSMTVT